MTATKNEETLEDLCEAIRRNAGDVADACFQVGCSTGWLRAWMRDDPKVGAAVEDAMATGAMVLESAMINRAVKGWEEPVYYKDELVGHKTKYSDTLLIKALESRLPERYGKKMEVNQNVNVRHMTDGELDAKINALLARPEIAALLPAPDASIEEGEFTPVDDFDVEDLL